MQKRAFDIALIVVTSIFWIPLLTVLAITILITSGNPMFYVSSRRVDRKHEVRIWKLRTMVKNAEKIANRDTVPVNGVAFLNIEADSPLYTRVGRRIERFDLTELPQLFHALLGQMSLVGSRPLPERVVEELRRTHPDVDERFRTKSGVAGPTQLVGRSNLTDTDRLDLEYRYSRIAETSYSFRMDFMILLGIVLIAVGIKKPLTYGEVVQFMARYDTSGINEPLKPRAVADSAHTQTPAGETSVAPRDDRRREAS